MIPDIIGSRDSHAVAIAVKVCNAAVRMLAFWSDSAVQIGRTKRRACFSKGFSIPVAIRETMSSAKTWTALFVSVTRALRI